MPQLNLADDPVAPDGDGWWQRLQAVRPVGRGGETVVDPYRSATISRRLLVLIASFRLLAAAAGVVVLLVLSHELRVPFPLLQTGGILLALALMSLLARLRIERRATITEGTFLVQVLGDVLTLTVVLALAGGFPSPFDEIYFVPLTIAAYTMGWRRNLIVVAVIAACFVVLYRLGAAGVPAHPLWVDFLAHAVLGGTLTALAFIAAKTLREHERQVARIREEAHVARSAAALHGMAAQAAHSLSTPLGTMAIEIGELRAGTLTSAERTDTLDTLAKQVEVCKEHLSHLLASTGGARGDGARSMRVDELAHALCEDYELMHPAATVELDVDGVEPAPSTVVERTLYDALVSLLDECGRDPPCRVTVVVTWGASDLTIRVAGAGSWAVSQINFPGQIAKPVAPPAFDGGRGSLTLAATIVDRFGGTVSYRPGIAGKWVQVVLPLAMSRSKQP